MYENENVLTKWVRRSTRSYLGLWIVAGIIVTGLVGLWYSSGTEARTAEATCEQAMEDDVGSRVAADGMSGLVTDVGSATKVTDEDWSVPGTYRLAYHRASGIQAVTINVQCTTWQRDGQWFSTVAT